MAGNNLVNITDQVELAMPGVPEIDSTDNTTFQDVIGNKDDTVAGDSVIALLKAIKAKTDTIA